MTVLRAGLIGAHISRTRLPAALQIMCDAHGITLEFDLIDTGDDPEFDFRTCVDELRQFGWSGVTVTHPFKLEAADYAGTGMVDEVSHLTSSNTLTFGVDICGFNTDYSGFMGAFQAFQTDPVESVLMIGSGGVAHALGPALDRLMTPSAKVFLYDTDRDKADTLAQQIGSRAQVITDQDVPSVVKNSQGLINATPMGMAEYPGSAFNPDWIGGKNEWAFDAVYTPTNTRFLQDAEHAGLRCLSGFALFQHMAMRSFEAYTGIAVDPVEMLPQLNALKPD
jgi:shikimate dehydrogenase